MAETTRDLVVRIRFERVGASDTLKVPDMSGPSKAQDQYNRTVNTTNETLDRFAKNATASAQAEKGFNSSIRDGLKPMLDQMRAMRERLATVKESVKVDEAATEAQARLSASNMANEEASKRLSLAYRRQYDLGVVETVNRLARGVAFLAASNKDSAEEMARNVIQFTAAMDLFRGGAEVVARLRNVYLGLTAALAGYRVMAEASAAAQTRLNATQMAGAVGSGASFLGVGGRAGSILAGTVGAVTSGVGLAVGGTLAAAGIGLFARREAGRISRGEDSFTEGMFNNRFVGGLLDFSGASSTGLLTNAERRNRSAEADQRRLEFEQNSAQFRGQIFNTRSRINQDDLAGTLREILRVRQNIASNQQVVGNANFSDLDRAIASGRLVEDFQRLDTLLRQEAQIKERTSKEAIRTESEKLTLLERQLRTAEREFEKRSQEFDRGVARFAELRPFEQRRALDAADKLRGGQELNRRERDLVQGLGNSDLDALLQRQLERQALQAGAGAIFQRPDETNLQQRRDEVEQQRKVVDELKDQAQKSGERMAATIKQVMESMVQAMEEKLRNDQSADRDTQNAQKGAAAA